MSARTRKNEVTRTTIHRVCRIGEEFRQAVSARRRALKLTVRAYLVEAIEGELPGLVEALRAHLPSPQEGARPARLPMTEAVLDALGKASQDVGVPAARPLLACLARASTRKRRRPGAAPAARKAVPRPRGKREAGKSREEAEGEPTRPQDAEETDEDGQGWQTQADDPRPEGAAETAGEPMCLAQPAWPSGVGGAGRPGPADDVAPPRLVAVRAALVQSEGEAVLVEVEGSLMDLHHVCHLIAETMEFSSGNLLGEDARAVQAHVAVVGEDAGAVVLAVEHREDELAVRELNRRPARPADCTVLEQGGSPAAGYRKARLPGQFRQGAIEITALEFALGQQSPRATVLHVRGTCAGDMHFAGCLVISEGRDVPTHDLRTFGAPLDLVELAVAIDRLLGASEPVVRDEIRRICE
jgi:hypothetical protein